MRFGPDSTLPVITARSSSPVRPKQIQFFLTILSVSVASSCQNLDSSFCLFAYLYSYPSMFCRAHVFQQVEVWLGQVHWGGPLHRPQWDQCRHSLAGHQSCSIWGAGRRWQRVVWAAAGHCGWPQILRRSGEDQSGSSLFFLATDLKTKDAKQNCHRLTRVIPYTYVFLYCWFYLIKWIRKHKKQHFLKISEHMHMNYGQVMLLHFIWRFS